VVLCSQPDWSLLIPLLKAALTSPGANFQASSEAQGSRESARHFAGSVIAPEAASASTETKVILRLGAGRCYTPLSSHKGLLLQMRTELCS